MLCLCVRTVQDVVERAHGGELEDKNAEVGGDGVPEQADEVVVPERREHRHLLPQERVVGDSEALQVLVELEGGVSSLLAEAPRPTSLAAEKDRVALFRSRAVIGSGTVRTSSVVFTDGEDNNQAPAAPRAVKREAKRGARRSRQKRSSEPRRNRQSHTCKHRRVGGGRRVGRLRPAEERQDAPPTHRPAGS